MKQAKKIVVFLVMLCVLTLSNSAYVIRPMEKLGLESVTSVEAADGAITVNSSSEKVAAKIHKRLYAGKGVTLRIKGSSKTAGKTLKKLKKQIQQTNEQGVIFQCSKTKERGGYTYYTISGDNAKLYMYSVKFVNKLYKRVKGWIDESLNEEINQILYQDYIKFNKDEATWLLHIVYDQLVYNVLDSNGLVIGGASDDYVEYTHTMEYQNKYPQYTDSSGWLRSTDTWNDGVGVEITGFSESTTKGGEALYHMYGWETAEAQYDIFKEAYEKDGVFVIQLKTYEEFISDQTIKEKYSKRENVSRVNWNFPSKNALYLWESENFASLSQAQKVLIIGDSKYFSDHQKYFSDHQERESGEYWMVYDKDDCYKSGYKGMKLLYQNKAGGVCEDYARYEILLMDQLDIPCYYNSNHAIDHAWTVIKAKNSKGKTLWIPFDYGIGISVVKSYKMAFDGIPGAPSKKNFSDSDFI